MMKSSNVVLVIGAGHSYAVATSAADCDGNYGCATYLALHIPLFELDGNKHFLDSN